MSLKELYQWRDVIMQHFPNLGYWQGLNLAIYSMGVMLARQCAPSRVAEKLGMMGKADTVQRRLERFLHNPQINWGLCCQYWSKWVLGCFDHEHIVLLVDETKLRDRLSIMVVGLAYKQCCIPLAFWCYAPQAWPMKQVDLIMELLSWVMAGVPAGRVAILQADRGIGNVSAIDEAYGRDGLALFLSCTKQQQSSHAQGKMEDP